MEERTTVAAISTPLAPGALGVIRVSGPKALQVAQQVFRPLKGKPLSQMKGYTAALGRVFDRQGEIDEAVALVFRAPHSYTGEDVVELSCHGGPYLLTRTLHALFWVGATPAAAGEFTRRAFLNGKLSLTQAEAVMDLIASEGRQAAKAALQLKDGALYRRVQGILDPLTQLCATLSAWVDYPDDEIPELSPQEMSHTLEQVQRELESLTGSYEVGQLVKYGVDTCIVGKPNVGKSTLMNLLSGEETSIVTEIPGTTRDLVEARVAAGDVILNLTDTAGLRDTEDPVEKIGVERARKKLESASLILAVLDCSQPLSQEDRELLTSLEGKPALVLVNKTDLQPAFSPKELDFCGLTRIFLSAKTGEGRDQLVQAIGSLLHMEKLDGAGGILANGRQLQCAGEALELVRQAREALEQGMTLDAIDVTLAGAVSALLSLTGEKAEERIIDEIFSRFCVGK